MFLAVSVVSSRGDLSSLKKVRDVDCFPFSLATRSAYLVCMNYCELSTMLLTFPVASWMSLARSSSSRFLGCGASVMGRLGLLVLLIPSGSGSSMLGTRSYLGGVVLLPSVPFCSSTCDAYLGSESFLNISLSWSILLLIDSSKSVSTRFAYDSLVYCWLGSTLR